MQTKRQKDLAKLTKLDAACNTILSLLFMVLMVLFVVFVLDLLGLIHLTTMFTFVKKGQLEVNANMPFIISTVQEPVEKEGPALVGQAQNPKQNLFKVEEVETAINTPTIDHKKYRYFELKNGLRILLIKDDQATMAEASMNVQAGSWNEPKEFPGLAHFCEHMLFEGSSKFPDVGYFDELVSGTGGYSNAYTEATNTNYYFTVGANNLLKTLNVFSHFFVDPLFSQSSVDKEINAVNSEYEIDVNGDAWKVVNLFTLLSDQSHPQSRFTFGNTESLTKEDIVKALKQFHSDYYSANLMTLAIRSNQDLKKLEQWLIKKSDFKKIKNKNLPENDIKGQPFTTNLGSIIRYSVDSDTKSIILNYQLPGRDEFINTKPIEFINYFVNSLHKGGLIDQLKQQGLIEDLEADVFIENSDFCNYQIIISLMNNNQSLTQEQKQEQQEELAIQLAQISNNYFQYLKDQFFSEEKPNQVLQDFYEEQSRQSEVSFKYMDDGKGTTLADIAYISKSLSQHKTSEVLSADFLMNSFEPLVIKSYLDNMIDSSNLIILIGDDELKTDISSALYKIDYSIEKIQNESIQQIFSKTTNNFTLPTKNQYIPEESMSMKKTCEMVDKYYQAQLQLQPQNLDEYDPYTFNDKDSLKITDNLNTFIVTSVLGQFKSEVECNENELQYEKSSRYPQLLEKSKNSEVWYKMDRSFEVPAVYSAVRIETKAFTSVKERVLMSLLSEQLKDNFQEELNQALSAGYEMDIRVERNSLQIQMYGFSEKIKEFYFQIVNSSSLNPNADTAPSQADLEANRFIRVKESLDQALRDTFERKLFEQATQIYLPQIMTSPFYSPEDQLEALNDLTYDDFQIFKIDVMVQSRVTSLFVGNILQDEAKELADILKTYNLDYEFKSATTQTLNLGGQNIVYAITSLSSEENDPNAATLNYFQIGRRNKKDYAIMQLLNGYFNTKAYNYLRTEKQLGYVVAAGFKSLGCIDGAVIIVQGSSKYPYEVNQLIEEFLQKFGDELHDMKKKQLQEIKEGVLEGLQEDIKSLQNEGDNFWEHIIHNDLAFQERQASASQVTKLKLQDVVDFYERVFMSSTRGKLSLQLYGKGMISQIETSSGLKFTEAISNKGLTEEQSIVKLSESVIFDSKTLSDVGAYKCDYEVSGI